jgi:nucleotide-binding universal stress UspA family protein
VKIETIVVPVDFSDDASAAFDYAIDLAEHFSATIHLLHAYESLSATASAYGGGLPLDLPERIREAAAAKLSQWQARPTRRKVAIETHLTPARPSAAVTDLAARLNADLIVMGTRGLSGLLHVLMGSVAERTLRTAPCPVLTVKHDA